jgi:hypothetical protein
VLSPTSETTPARERAHVEPSPARYARRRPDKTVLHQVVRENAEMLFAEARRRSESGAGYPAHVEREFRRYLDCGILAAASFASTARAAGMTSWSHSPARQRRSARRAPVGG